MNFDVFKQSFVCSTLEQIDSVGLNVSFPQVFNGYRLKTMWMDPIEMLLMGPLPEEL